MMSKRRKQQQRRQIAGCITGLLAIILIGGWLNWVSYSAWVCQEVPNHYSCE